MERQVLRLSGLIDVLLDVTRLQSGRLALHREQIDLAATARETVESLAEQLRVAQCALTLDASAPVLGEWDRMRLQQALTNLLTNAIKYAAGKPITVRVSAGEKRAELVVSDGGPGISPRDQAQLFHRFARLRANRRSGGLGLGLYITRQIMEAHGGSVTVTATRRRRHLRLHAPPDSDARRAGRRRSEPPSRRERQRRERVNRVLGNAGLSGDYAPVRPIALLVAVLLFFGAQVAAASPLPESRTAARRPPRRHPRPQRIDVRPTRIAVQPIASESATGPALRAHVARILRGRGFRVVTALPSVSGTAQYPGLAHDHHIAAFLVSEVQERPTTTSVTFLVWQGCDGNVVGRWSVSAPPKRLATAVSKGFWPQLGRALAGAQPPPSKDLPPAKPMRIDASSEYDETIVSDSDLVRRVRKTQTPTDRGARQAAGPAGASPL
jgi:anti-sigma regulatory factor (Ser/Thr protein kinase)